LASPAATAAGTAQTVTVASTDKLVLHKIIQVIAFSPDPTNTSVFAVELSCEFVIAIFNP
jgi:hypothetical protein